MGINQKHTLAYSEDMLEVWIQGCISITFMYLFISCIKNTGFENYKMVAPWFIKGLQVHHWVPEVLGRDGGRV